jgi:methyl-accepting chemotaxis protein
MRIGTLFKIPVFLMNKLTYIQKFLLMTVCFSLCVITPFKFFHDTTQKDLLFSGKELEGARFNAKLVTLLQGYAEDNHTQIAQAIESLGHTPQALKGSYQLTSTLNDLQQLKTDDPYDANLFIRRLYREVMIKSNLLLDPELVTYTLMDLNSSLLPEAIMRFSALEYHIKKYLEMGKRYKDESDVLEYHEHRVIGLMVELKTINHKVITSLDTLLAQRFDAERRATVQQTARAYRTMATTVQAMLDKFVDKPNDSLFESLEWLADIRSALLSLNAASNDALTTMLQKRLDRIPVPFNTALVTTVAIYVLITYLLCGFYFATRGTVSSLRLCMSRLAKGDLTAQMHVDSRDELAAVVRGYNKLVNDLQDLIFEIQEKGAEVKQTAVELNDRLLVVDHNTEQIESTTSLNEEASDEMEQTVIQARQSVAGSNEEIDRVLAASRQVATVNKQLEDYVHNSTQAFETIAASVEEMSASISDVSNQTLRSTDISSRGQDAARQTLTMLDQLKQSIEKINKVVNVIQDIAAQTNTLAINAAIEAAHAGESGKGFVVVAGKVKALSIESAHTTSQVIQQAKTIDEHMNHAMETITHLLGIMEEMDQFSQTIADHVQQQSKVVRSLSDDIHRENQAMRTLQEQVSRSAEQIDHINNALSALTEEAAHLNENTQVLSNVARRVADGSSMIHERVRETSTQVDILLPVAGNLSDVAQSLHDATDRFVMMPAGSFPKG